MTLHYPLDAVTARSWRSAVRRLIPTPAAHRRADVGRDAARSLLGCDDATLDLLLEAGLPSSGTGDAARFDRFDLINVAIYGGAGRSVPEAAQRYVLRYADGRPDSWTEPRRWTLRWLLRCADQTCEGKWRVRLPTPELFGGSLTDPPGPDPLETTGPSVRITTGAVTAGHRAEVRSPVARALFDEVLTELETGRLRYQWLPADLGADLPGAVANGTLDCVAAALLLAERGRERGLSTRTRRGRMLGMIAVDHAWAEIRDDDGRWLPLDPVFALLGGTGRTGPAAAGFAAFCAGSVPGRFLPWDVAAGAPLAEHSCGAWTETFLASPA
ncbi:hypothetical protein GCM10022221_69370 [Actinocorallia aurea]